MQCRLAAAECSVFGLMVSTPWQAEGWLAACRKRHAPSARPKPFLQRLALLQELVLVLLDDAYSLCELLAVLLSSCQQRLLCICL
jgi:hypothetical protein